MAYVTEDWILEMTSDERKKYLHKTESLQTVKDLQVLNNTELMTTKMVADWYGVTEIIVRNLFNANRKELESSGAKTNRGEDLHNLKETVGGSLVTGNAITTFTMEAVLNVALLLRNSEVAKNIRLAVLDEYTANLGIPKSNELVIQEVDFNGKSLVAVKTEDDEKIYVGVSWVCEGIGLTEKQKDRQVMNMQKDIVLASGVKKLPLKFEGQVRNALAIELDYLPLWLAKISITPKMQVESPDVVNNLIEYQVKAKDVLAQAFINKKSFIVPSTYKEALQQVIDSIEENEILLLENEDMKPKAAFYDDTVDTRGSELILNTAKVLGIGEKKMFEFLRQTGVLHKEGRYSTPMQQYINSGYFEVVAGYRNLKGFHEQTFTTRLTEEGKRFIYRLVKRYGGGSSINQLKLKEIKEYVEKFKKAS